MRHLRSILQYGWPHLQHYLGRFIAGILLAIAFGLCNAGLLWAVNITLDRLSPPPPGQVAQSPPPSESRLAQIKADLAARSQSFANTWLPKTGDRPNWRQILGGILLFPTLALLRGTSSYLSSYCLAWVSERVVTDLRVRVLRKLLDLSLDFHTRSTMGDLVTRVNGDTAALQRCLSLGLSDLVKEPITVIGIVTGLILIDWHLTLVALVFFPLLVLPIVIYGRKVRKAATAGLHTSITQSSLLLEMMAGIRVVKAFNLENAQLERFRLLSRELLHHTMKWVRAKEIINPMIETVSTLGFGVVIVYIVFQQIQLKDMVTLLAGVAFIYTPVKKLAAIHVLLQQADAGIRRLLALEAEQPSVQEIPQPLSLAQFSHDLRLEDVSFTYGHHLVLQNLSIRIPRGSKLGIAGESGSGKSTLVNLLFRFYDPTSGSILIDGHDLRTLSLASLRHHMALVSQDIVLFDLSVADNIACGRPGCTQAEIEAAARAAFAHEFIRQLPQSYDTRIGERGVTLSGGQRQRLAIARAFVRNAPILVLDEATASLDSEAEAEVQTAIDRLTENRTVISVAHRLSTLRAMDRIIVLSGGRRAEEGTFSDLLAQGGAFAAMARKQGLAV